MFGPCIPAVYYHFCGFGTIPIMFLYEEEKEIIAKSDQEYIDKVVEQKRKLMPWEWETEIQNEDDAWAQVWQDGKGNKAVITKELIKRCR